MNIKTLKDIILIKNKHNNTNKIFLSFFFVLFLTNNFLKKHKKIKRRINDVLKINNKRNRYVLRIKKKSLIIQKNNKTKRK